ncbi:DUF4249 domain-containing protein [Flavobacteriaceae bacterium]|nr:DUF4249 domain-containing protein [Flavobacteriaceae bacterium]
MLITPLTHILVKRLQKHFKYGPMSIAFNGFKKILTVWFTGLLVVFTSSCITDYQGTIGGSSEVLVVNGLLTDEYKKQLVQLSRSYTFENAGPRYETDAAVSVSGSDGSLYSFYETPNGVYKSIAAFAAKAGVNYQLEITTVTGEAYASSPMGLPAPTQIQALKAVATTNAQGNPGISIQLDGSGPVTASRFRYDFTEHWKIVAPYWSPLDIVVLSEGQSTFNLAIIERETEERVCYGSARPQEVLLASTSALATNEVKNFPIRFIAKEDYILQQRYSIGVKQYGISEQTYSYYETLKSLSVAAENIFSEDQPGFLQGNMYALEDPEEKVAGFFEVSTVSEKRLFINFSDYFPGENLPDYVVNCIPSAPTTDGPLGSRELLNVIYNNSVRYYGINTERIAPGGTFLMVPANCGDCTTLGANIKPDFWID